MADLAAEGYAELDAFDVEGIVAPVGRREVPEPLHDPERLESELFDAAPEFAYRFHRAVKVGGSYSNQAFRIFLNMGGHLVVGDERAGRAPPCADQAFGDVRLVHGADGYLQWKLGRQ